MLEGRSLARVAAVKFRFALARAAARRAYFAHPAGYFDLPGVELAGVERLGHEVVVRFDHLVEHHRSLHGPVSRRRACARFTMPIPVITAVPLVSASPSRMRSLSGVMPHAFIASPRRRFLCRGTTLPIRRSAPARYAPAAPNCRWRRRSVARHERIYFVVEEIGQNPHVGMYARFGVEKGLRARKHGRPHADVGQRLARARSCANV